MFKDAGQMPGYVKCSESELSGYLRPSDKPGHIRVAMLKSYVDSPGNVLFMTYADKVITDGHDVTSVVACSGRCDIDEDEHEDFYIYHGD